MLFPATVLLETDKYIRDFLVRANLQGPMSTSEFHYRLGQDLLARTPGCRGVLGRGPRGRRGRSHLHFVPGDSSIGMNIAYHELMNGSTFMIDPNKDVNEICAIILAGKQNGCVILGGGSPKNFYLQGQPTLWEVYGIPKGGNDYFIQITTDQVVWGACRAPHPRKPSAGGRSIPACFPTRLSRIATRRLPSRCSASMRSDRRTAGGPGASCYTSGMSWWPIFSVRRRPPGKPSRSPTSRQRSIAIADARRTVPRLITWGWEGSWEHWRLS